MHQPRPRGLSAVGDAPTDADAAAVELLARRLENLKSLSGVESLRMVRDLPDGGYVIAQNMGGVFRCITHKPPKEKREPVEVEEDYVPMLFSGVVTKALVKEDEGVGIKLTETCRRRLAGYKAEGLPAKDVALKRFVIEYGDKFSRFKPEHPGIYIFTQYMRQRPTWYSGAMAEVMQIVGGYGRQTLSELPDDKIERARLRLPEKYRKAIEDEIDGLPLPGYTGAPDEKGQFQCDYLSSATNAVAFDSAGAPWLLKVFERGVFAMPLPVVPATTNEAFRTYMEDVGDDEILAILDRFGGMPTGEAFPESEKDFEAWRRAGAIVKVCDTADFYDYGATYAACGWSLNSTGSEGFNTCMEMRDNGMRWAHAYALRLHLVPAENRGRARALWEFADDDEMMATMRYLGELYGALENDHKGRAIKYKIARQPAAALVSRAHGSGAADVDYWDNVEASPIASHAGSTTRIASGPLYWPGKIRKEQGGLKFPVLSGEGTESFDFTLPDYGGGAVKSDAIVFGGYIDDELKVVKYFYDSGKYQRDEESTYEPMMIVGSWEKTVTTGSSQIVGNFYTSDDDDREALAPVVTNTKLVGTDLGYGEPLYITPAAMMCVGSLVRHRHYAHRETESIVKGEALRAAVCVPVHARDGLLYAYRHSDEGSETTEKTSAHAMIDPNRYQLWCYDNIFHYLFKTNNGNLGEPTSKDGTPVYVDTHTYMPTEYSDFADGGNWFNLPDGSFIDVTAICGIYTSRSSGTFQAGGVAIGGKAPGFSPYYKQTVTDAKSAGFLTFCATDAGHVRVHKNIPGEWFFSYSPENDSYFYRDIARVTFGKSTYVSLSETAPNGLRRYWGATDLADHKIAHHFIGVINE